MVYYTAFDKTYHDAWRYTVCREIFAQKFDSDWNKVGTIKKITTSPWEWERVFLKKIIPLKNTNKVIKFL